MKKMDCPTTVAYLAYLVRKSHLKGVMERWSAGKRDSLQIRRRPQMGMSMISGRDGGLAARRRKKHKKEGSRDDQRPTPNFSHTEGAKETERKVKSTADEHRLTQINTKERRVLNRNKPSLSF